MRERMSKQQAVEMLEKLVALDYDAIETYESALDHIDDETLRDALGDFKRDHERHIAELGPVVTAMGGTPPDSSDFHGVINKSKIALADLAGDAAVLNAVHTSAEQTHEAYAKAAAQPELPDEVHEILARSREDEHRHRDWLASKLRML
jgi:uncharacterized protein (TIGR02284 family)